MNRTTTNDLEKFKRYIGKPSTLELEAEDGTKEAFELKPLPFENLDDILLIGKTFAKIPDIENQANIPIEKFLEILDKDTIDKMKNIVKITLETSYPDLPKEIREGFGSKNFLPLITKIFEINSMGGKTEAIQKRLAQMRSNKP